MVKRLCIFIGQASCAVGRQIQSLSTSLTGAEISELHISDELPGQRNATNNGVFLEKCSHSLLFKASLCACCERNRNNLKNALQVALEKIENAYNITFMIDYYSLFGHCVSHFVVKFLKTCCPGAVFTTILLQPYSNLGRLNGCEVFVALLTACQALHSSAAVIIRGFHDIITNPSLKDMSGSNDIAFESGMSLELAQRALACDLFLIVVDPSLLSCPDNSHRYLWPLEVCSNTRSSCRIFDARSSLFKYLSVCQKKSRSTNRSFDHRI